MIMLIYKSNIFWNRKSISLVDIDSASATVSFEFNKENI